MVVENEESQNYFKELYAKYHQTVYKYVLVSLDFNETLTADCVQEVFLTVYEKIEVILEHPNPGGFLIVTARNYIKKYKSKQQQQTAKLVPLEDEKECLAYEQDFEQVLEEEVDIDGLKQTLLGRLSEQDYGLYTMFYEKKYSVAKIANLLHITQGNVRVRLFRLRFDAKKIIPELIQSGKRKDEKNEN